MARSSSSDGILLSAPRSRAANAPQAQPAFPAESHPRLAIMTPSRLLLGSVASTFVGFTLGAVQGGQMAQLRFRAEHAHKMPDTTTGWYLYHKSKNYHAMQGGIREGFRMGLKTGFWSLMALSLESTVDRYRGSSDMFSTVVATLTVAGAFSLWREFVQFPFFFSFTILESLLYDLFSSRCPKGEWNQTSQAWLSPARALACQSSPRYTGNRRIKIAWRQREKKSCKEAPEKEIKIKTVGTIS